MRSRFAQVLGVLLAVLAVGAVASSAAFAATPEWQFEGKAIKTALKVEGIWKEMKLTDSALGETLTCTASSTNSITAKLLETSSATWLSCSQSQGACGNKGSYVGTAVTLGLPWTAELYEESGKVRERIKGHKGKEVGWAFTCTIGGILTSQECSASELTAALSNVTGGVDAAFDSKTPKLVCNGELGGEGGVGTLEGTELLEDKGLTVT